MKTPLAVVCIFLITALGQANNEPDDVPVCEGGGAMFSCELNTANTNISSDDVQWYRVIKNTGTTEIIDPNGMSINFTTNNRSGNLLTTNLTITNAVTSYTGYYWVKLSSNSFCNTSVTVRTKPSALKVNTTKNIGDLSVVVQWNEVDDSLNTTYMVTWTNGTTLVDSPILIEQSPYTITGLTLDTVYNITVTASNRCGTGQGNESSVSFPTVISEPHDVDVCNGTATTITCLLNSNNEGDIQWYRFMKNTSTTKMIVSHDDDFIIPTPTGNTINNSLIITNTRKSHIGYYWVKLPSFNVCNVSLTVLESPPALTVNITKNTESSSIVVQWDEVDDSLPTTYTVTWTSERDLNNVQIKNLEEQSSYTITGLTLDTVYTITVTAANMCGTGPEYSTSVSLTSDSTSSITPNTTTVMNLPTTDPTTDPTTTTVVNASMANTTDATIMSTVNSSNTSTATAIMITNSSTATISISATTIISSPATIISSAIYNAQLSTTTNAVVISSVATATNHITTTVSIITDTTTDFIETTSLKTAIGSTNPSTFATAIVMSSTSTTNSADTTTADETSNSSVYIIVGVIIGVIIVLSLLFIIMICCFIRKKGKSNKKNEYSDLTGNGTLDTNIPMVSNPLSTNGDDGKPAKLEAETSHETVEVQYMIPYIGSNVGSNTNSKQCNAFGKSPSLTKEKEDTTNQQPLEYAVVDKSKKTKKKDDKQEQKKVNTEHKPIEYAVVDKSKKTKKKNEKQEKVDDPQNGANNVHQHDVTVPPGDNQTSDGRNQSKTNPTLHYAELERLPKPTKLNYIPKDDPITQYAQIV